MKTKVRKVSSSNSSVKYKAVQSEQRQKHSQIQRRSNDVKCEQEFRRIEATKKFVNLKRVKTTQDSEERYTL